MKRKTEHKQNNYVYNTIHLWLIYTKIEHKMCIINSSADEKKCSNMLEISDGNQRINEFNYHQSHVFLCHKTSHVTQHVWREKFSHYSSLIVT